MEADTRLLLNALFAAERYLAFLEKYDLKPSQAAHLHGSELVLLYRYREYI